MNPRPRFGFPTSVPRIREQLHAATRGRCYYCGIHVRIKDIPPVRDWLMLKWRSDEMVIEHPDPLIRGGAEFGGNRVASCSACNAAKSAMNAAEFRFVRGLRAGTLSFEFYGEKGSRQKRDWLCCHSREFERKLFVINFPAGAIAYSRGKRGRVNR